MPILSFCPLCQRCVRVGIAFHHGGLTLDEREVIETSYRHGHIDILCATSTLAAGVNLPAKRVILDGMMLGIDMISVASYKQMSGRAGRAGQDDMGEAILMVKKDEEQKAIKLMTEPLRPLQR
jgi:DNA polymerase theta